MDAQTLAVDQSSRVRRGGLAACVPRLPPHRRAGVGTGPTINCGHQRTGRAVDFGAFSWRAASAAGVDLVTAVVLAAEIGDFKRFRTPKQLMSYLGLVPSEHSSGNGRRQGGITRTGNRHARWVLVEAAWNYRFRPCASKRINARQQLVAAGVRSIAQRAQQRLSRRFRKVITVVKAARKP